MKWRIEIDSDDVKTLDSAIFKVYLDIKKKTYITKQPIPSSFTELDCDCKEKVKYRVSEYV